MKLRKALPEDAPHFVRIKNALPMRRADGTYTNGGFLLGTTEETYRQYICNAWCVVAESVEGICGFGIVLPDAQVKASELWQKRRSAQWAVSPALYERQPIAYFEQIAFLPGRRRLVVKLACNMALEAFRSGAVALLTTTVREPVLNLAAVPFILAAGGIKAGEIDEHYPAAGPIRSDIYCMDRDVFYQRLAGATNYPLLAAMLRSMAL